MTWTGTVATRLQTRSEALLRAVSDRRYSFRVSGSFEWRPSHAARPVRGACDGDRVDASSADRDDAQDVEDSMFARVERGRCNLGFRRRPQVRKSGNDAAGADEVLDAGSERVGFVGHRRPSLTAGDDGASLGDSVGEKAAHDTGVLLAGAGVGGIGRFRSSGLSNDSALGTKCNRTGSAARPAGREPISAQHDRPPRMEKPHATTSHRPME